MGISGDFKILKTQFMTIDEKYSDCNEKKHWNLNEVRTKRVKGRKELDEFNFKFCDRT